MSNNEPQLDTNRVAELLAHMQPGDTLRREKEAWHFQRYHGNHWIDITHKLIERAIPTQKQA